MPREKKKTVSTFMITYENKDALKRLSNATGESMSQLLDEMLNEYLHIFKSGMTVPEMLEHVNKEIDEFKNSISEEKTPILYNMGVDNSPDKADIYNLKRYKNNKYQGFTDD